MLLCDASCWLLLGLCLGWTYQGSCGMAFPETMYFWEGIVVRLSGVKRVLENSLSAGIPKSLLESLLCRKDLHGMAFSGILSSIFLPSLTVIAFYCLGLAPAIPEGLMDGESSAGLSYKPPSCSWVRIYWTGSALERGERPRAQCGNSSLPLFRQLQDLSWEVPAQHLNLGPVAVQRRCCFHWPCMGSKGEGTLRALPLRKT